MIMTKTIDLSKAVDEIDNNKELKDLVGINPETGEFDIDFVPEAMRQDVIDMGKAMIKQQKKKGCHRKKKARVNVKKTHGQNKKKKKKK
jgi:hypothetical protein